jgi:hypothetical protein
MVYIIYLNLFIMYLNYFKSYFFIKYYQVIRILIGILPYP